MPFAIYALVLTSSLAGLSIFSPRASARPTATTIPEVARLFTDDVNLPGRELLFTDFNARLGLDDYKHPARTAMMNATYEFLGERAQAESLKYGRACESYLESRDPRRVPVFNRAISEYLNYRGVANDVENVSYVNEDDVEVAADHRVRILPVETGATWLARLSWALHKLPHPVALFVYPSLFDESGDSMDYQVTPEHRAVRLAPRNIIARSASLATEHELFHVWQTEILRENPDHGWPDHTIRSTRQELFTGEARAYIAWPGYFAIEEIGAYTRDAVQTALALAHGNTFRFGETSARQGLRQIARNRRNALSFAKTATRVYRTLLMKLRAGDVTPGDVRFVPEDGSTSIRVLEDIEIALMGFELDGDWRDHLRREAERALTWISAYRRFLVEPDRH